jgi:hemolysin activation/secretion protein
VTLASVGVGLRGEWRNNASLSLDVARVVQSHAAADSDSGDLRAHFAINVLF